MDCQNYATITAERKRGQHLQRENRGAIQSLVRQGLSRRAITKELNCSPTTISNELKLGYRTPEEMFDNFLDRVYQR